MLGYSFNIINTIYPIRGVYISSQIQPEQINYIQNSINKIGFNQTFNKNDNHIRIQYADGIIANTAMIGSVYNTGNFIIDETIISFNYNLYNEILGCVILHELFHSAGLNHNNISGSIMNFSLYIDKNGLILNDNVECELSQDDLLSLEYVKKKHF